MSKYVITYDVGTTGVKTCLIEIGDTMRILASDTAGYGLYVDCLLYTSPSPRDS